MKLSILVLAYNHAPYIEQAIQSALDQITTFEVEIVVGEDCSADDTRAILKRLQAQHPDKIRLRLPAKNQGMHHNFVNTLQKCRGEYVAVLEGDDYWLSPYKLQTQVAYLEAYTNCSFCFHDAYNCVEEEREPYIAYHRVPRKPFYNLADIAPRHFIPTSSLVFRNHLINPFPAVFFTAPGLDRMLCVMLAERGAGGMIDRKWSVRRVHANGMISGATTVQVLRHIIRTTTAVANYLGRDRAAIVRQTAIQQLTQFVTVLMHEKMTPTEPDGISAEITKAHLVEMSALVARFAEPLHLTSAEQEAIVGECSLRLTYLFHSDKALDLVWPCWKLALRKNGVRIAANIGFWSVGTSAFFRTLPRRMMPRLLTQLVENRASNRSNVY